MTTATVDEFGECIHGIQAEWCASCTTGIPSRPPVRRPIPAPVQSSRPMPAIYPGHCFGCNLQISPGHVIVRMTDDTYRHSGCAS